MFPEDLARVSRQLQARVKDGRDGRDGVDGEPGRDGKDGRRGEPGVDGKDGKRGLPGKAGIDGKDGQSIQGKDGERGPRGQIGPMPAHRWIDDTKLQFEQAPGGEWGKAVDLRGPKGSAGRDGAGGGVIVQQDGGSSSGYGYFPQGWA